MDRRSASAIRSISTQRNRGPSRVNSASRRHNSVHLDQVQTQAAAAPGNTDTGLSARNDNMAGARSLQSGTRGAGDVRISELPFIKLVDLVKRELGLEQGMRPREALLQGAQLLLSTERRQNAVARYENLSFLFC